MKVLTLTQPYASLVAIGAKHIETRSWETLYRGPMAIHAAKGLGPVGGKRGLYDLCYSQPFLSVLEPAMTGEREIAGFTIPHIDPGNLPLGAIVAVCELRGCRIIGQELNGDATIAADDMFSWTPILGNERAFGNYAPGRYAWLLANVRALPEPIPAKGALGLWNYEGEL